MEKKLLTFFMIAFQTVLFGHDVVVTEEDNGTTINVEINDTICAKLSGNPSTGYTWEEQLPVSAIFREAGREYVPSHPGLCGAGGEFSFSFHVVSVGSAPLSFIYHRPWETDVPPIQTFTVTVNVANPL